MLIWQMQSPKNVRMREKLITIRKCDKFTFKNMSGAKIFHRCSHFPSFLLSDLHRVPFSAPPLSPDLCRLKDHTAGRLSSTLEVIRCLSCGLDAAPNVHLSRHFRPVASFSHRLPLTSLGTIIIPLWCTNRCYTSFKPCCAVTFPY